MAAAALHVVDGKKGDILLLLGGKYSHKYNNIAALASDFPLWNIVVAVVCFILPGRSQQAGPSYREPKECFCAWYKFSERWSPTTFCWKRVPPFCRQKRNRGQAIPDKTGCRARPELTWPRVTAVVRLASERGVEVGVIKELVSEYRQRRTKTKSFKLAPFSMEYRLYFCRTKLK